MSDIDISTDPPSVFNEREFHARGAREDFSTRRTATISDVPPRRDGDGNFIFIIFRDCPSSRAWNRASRDIRRALAKGEDSTRKETCPAERIRSTNVTRDIPRSCECAMFHHRFIIVVCLEIFALSKSARFFFGYRSDRAGRAL